MDRLLNNAPPEDTNDEIGIKNEVLTVVSPSSSAASLGLQMLSVLAAAPGLSTEASTPPRLPPISLLTAAATALQPIQCQSIYPRALPETQLQSLNLMSWPLATAGPSATDDMMCRYRNKKCGYPRAIKRNGERHNLCERHRAKANLNQRKLESKRRTLKRMM